MRSHRKYALAALVAIGAGTIGYGVAAAATPSPKGPPTPAAHALPQGVHPQAGNGNSPLPPARPESVYVPITNCRAVSTAVAGGVIPNGATRSFYIVGAAGFPGQGGQSGGCGIPASATAISARITASYVSANGAFVAYPTGTPIGQGTLYYAKGVNVTTGATLQLGPGTGKVLTVKDVSGPAQLSIDINGYYEEQIEGMLSPTGAVYAGSNRIVSAVHNGTGSYTVTMDTNVAYCTPAVMTYNGHVYASAYNFDGNKVHVSLWYLNGTTHLEVAEDAYFYVSVSC